MVPFFTFYSMFGFQRVGDLIWSAADSRARGFLLGRHRRAHDAAGRGTPAPGRPQPVLASTVPTVEAWDPAFAYEMAAIVRHGIHEMLVDERDVIYYITLYNENYVMPPPPEGAGRGHHPGPVPLGRRPGGETHRATILFSGTARARPGPRRPSWPSAGTWAPTCGRPPAAKRLREDALSIERWNRLHPTEAATPVVTDAARRGRRAGGGGHRLHEGRARPGGPVVPAPFITLGTDGFGGPTPASSCGRSSRSTCLRSWWPPCGRWPSRARSRPSW